MLHYCVSFKSIALFLQFKTIFENGESTEYAGKACAYLAADSNIMKKSGKILLASDLGDEYGFVDINGMVLHCRTYLFIYDW